MRRCRESYSNKKIQELAKGNPNVHAVLGSFFRNGTVIIIVGYKKKKKK